MPITASEMPLHKSEVIVNGPTNGGYRDYVEVVTGESQNNFPDVFIAERESGSTTVRFNYACNHSANQQVAQNMLIWLDNETSADDYVYFSPMSHGDTQADIAGTEDIYTVANLKNDITAGTKTVVVDCPTASAADTYSRDLTDAFVQNRKVKIIGKEFPDSGTGNVELHTIDTVPVVSGTEVSFDTANQIVNGYTVAAGCRVSVVYEAGTVQPTADAMTETFASGSVDDTTYPVDLDNAGTIEDVFTFVFSDNTNFTCSGVRAGSLGAGTTTADFAPTNPDSSTPYFTIDQNMWQGTRANTEQAELTTHDSSVALAQIRVIPVNAGPMTQNRATICISCESV